jgi:glycosyltransferase involved in cell wall biosynthesis
VSSAGDRNIVEMSVTAPPEGQRLALERGSVAVCIPVTGPVDLLNRCLHSVNGSTARGTPVLIVEESPREPAVKRLLSSLDLDAHHLVLADSPGPVAVANAALEACAPADVVLLASHAIVFEEWLDRICAAGRSDSTVGTVSALGNNAGLASVPEPHEPLPQDVDAERLAAAVAERASRAWPRTPAADGHCVWVSRSALELAGPLDTSFGSLRAALIDLSQRMLQRGLVNVVADDVFVASAMPEISAFGAPLAVGDDRPLLEQRYPYLRGALEGGPPPAPLSHSVSAARRRLRPLSVTVDARILRGAISGVQAETLELIDLLTRTGEARVRVLLDPAIGPDAIATLERVPELKKLWISDVGTAVEPTDIVHRPYQVSSTEDLELLPRLGERLVITHLDLIAFHNPGYFGSFRAWQQYRRVTRQALAMADRVLFLSNHAAEDAVREGLLDRERTTVVPMVVNSEPDFEVAQRRPAGFPDGEFLLCIGNDFRHKNRPFAIKLLGELRRRGWDGMLVLAGPHVEYGSSVGDEAALLAEHPDLATAVKTLPAVRESEKHWLYRHAAALLYPSVYEGFGLIPFEAARAGRPCFFAPQASLAEVLPVEASVLVPWDPVASAERVLAVLRDPGEQRRLLELVRASAARFESRDAIGQRLLALYERTAELPFREASAIAADARTREAELARWIGLEENLGPLVGPDAYLPRDTQRALLAMATRKRLRKPLFALLESLYRIGYRARRR